MGMRHGWIALLVLCASFCRAHYYANGFPIEGDKRSCFCADVVSKSTPIPFVFTLRWYDEYREVEDEPDVFMPRYSLGGFE